VAVNLGRNTVVSDDRAGQERMLDWSDAIRPTILAALSLGAALLVVLPLLLAGLRRLQAATQNPGVRVLPIIAFAVLFTVVSFAALADKARDRKFENSYMMPPAAVVVCALLVCIVVATDTEADVQAVKQAATDAQEFRANLNDPKFVMKLKPPVPATEMAVLREELVNANPKESRLSGKEIHALLGRFGGDLEDAIGECPKTAADDLAWIAAHGGVPGRKAVATNASAPESIVRRLLKDGDGEVVLAAENNLARRICDPELLQKIWERAKKSNLSPDDNLYLLLARNSCTPHETLAALGAYPDAVGRTARQTLAGR